MVFTFEARKPVPLLLICNDGRNDAMREKPKHGTYSKYVQGCRCEMCREANTVYAKSNRERRRVLDAEYMSDLAARVRAETPTSEALEELLDAALRLANGLTPKPVTFVSPSGKSSRAKHGAPGTLYTRGCRCDECKAFHRDYVREYRARRKGQADGVHV